MARRDFELSDKLVDRGLSEERTPYHVRSAHLAHLCSGRVGAGAGEDPFAKLEDLIGNDARDDYDLKTSMWQEDEAQVTVELDGTSTQKGWLEQSQRSDKSSSGQLRHRQREGQGSGRQNNTGTTSCCLVLLLVILVTMMMLCPVMLLKLMLMLMHMMSYDDDTFQQRSPLSMSWDTQCPKPEMLPGRLPDATRGRG